MSAAVDLNQGLVNAALEIAERQSHILRQLRSALERGDDALALSLARKVCGLNEKSHRTVESIDRRTSRRR